MNTNNEICRGFNSGSIRAYVSCPTWTKRLDDFRKSRRTQDRLLSLAYAEAEALAWESGYPHLLLPVLAEEKAAAVQQWKERQRRLNPGIEAVAFAE